jgi:hypothetical protein
MAKTNKQSVQFFVIILGRRKRAKHRSRAMMMTINDELHEHFSPASATILAASSDATTAFLLPILFRCISTIAAKRAAAAAAARSMEL